MAKRTPTIQDKIFTLWDYDLNRRIFSLDITGKTDWPSWLAWLNSETTRSVRFIARDGSSCTLIKEPRAYMTLTGERRRRWVWYAHKRLAGKLRRRYIGKSENLTHKRLKDVAFELSQRKF